MALKTRNIIFLIIFAMIFAFLIINAALLFYNIHADSLVEPNTFPIMYVSSFYPIGYSFTAVITSLFLFLIFASSAILYLYIQFEKTQSIEVIFFAAFLTGCAAEAIRLYVPFFNLWNSISTFLIFVGRVTLFGRILAPAALLFDAVFSSTDQRQNVERNLIVLLVMSIALSLLIPLNTAIVLPNFCVHWGASKTFSTIRIFILIAAILSVFINTRTMGIKEKAPYGFFALIMGYEICCLATSVVAVITGSILLFSGTLVYLGSLHSRYLWQ